MAYKITFDGWWWPGSVMYTTDLSCASVSTGTLTWLHTVAAGTQWDLRCSDDPMPVGGKVFFCATGSAGSGNGCPQPVVITAIEGTAGSAAPTSWQDAIASQNTTIASLQTQFSTLQTTIGSNGSDPATIAASTTIFAALLVAAVTVYGLKSVWGLFREPGGHD